VMLGRINSSSGEAGWVWAMNHETKSMVREGGCLVLWCGIERCGVSLARHPLRDGRGWLVSYAGWEQKATFLRDVCLMIVQTVMGCTGIWSVESIRQ
jgi:hypothetical protein